VGCMHCQHALMQKLEDVPLPRLLLLVLLLP
jgi:hypothetical protein